MASSTPGRRTEQGSILSCGEAWGPSEIELLSCLQVLTELGRLQGDEMECSGGHHTSKTQLNRSSWNTPQHSVLKAKSSNSFKPVTQTPQVYQDSGTQLSSLWDLGLQ